MAISQKHELSIKVKQRNVCFDCLRVLVNRYFIYPVTRVLFLWPELNITANQKEQLLQHTVPISRPVGGFNIRQGFSINGKFPTKAKF